jgi:hypothetical protein
MGAWFSQEGETLLHTTATVQGVELIVAIVCAGGPLPMTTTEGQGVPLVMRL